MPIVATYLRALRKGLDAAGIPARLLLMQSNGGLTTDTAAVERPMNIIESGPGRRRGRRAGAGARKELDKIITFDMGGTTAKASMVEDGEVARAHGIRGRRRDHDRLAAAHGRGLYAQGAGDRSRRSRRRRRLACLDRCRRRAAGRAGERGRLARPGLLRHGRRDADRDRRQRAARLHQSCASGRRRAQAQCREGARGVRGEDRQAARHVDRAARPTARIRSPPPT